MLDLREDSRKQTHSTAPISTPIPSQRSRRYIPRSWRTSPSSSKRSGTASAACVFFGTPMMNLGSRKRRAPWFRIADRDKPLHFIEAIEVRPGANDDTSERILHTHNAPPDLQHADPFQDVERLRNRRPCKSCCALDCRVRRKARSRSDVVKSVHQDAKHGERRPHRRHSLLVADERDHGGRSRRTPIIVNDAPDLGRVEPDGIDNGAWEGPPLVS